MPYFSCEIGPSYIKLSFELFLDFYFNDAVIFNL